MLTATLLSAFSFVSASFVTAPEHPPNIVVILVDDLGYRDIGVHGCVDFETPHIDALAAEGVRATAGYVSHPYCSPSRAGILTGRYQQRFGHEHNPRYDESDETIGTDVNERMLPKLFSAAGYATSHIGKWHVGAAPPFRPLSRGYGEFFGFLGGGHDYFRADGDNEYRSPLWRDSSTIDTQPTYLTDDLTNEAVAFIDRNHDRPFFLLLAYNAPHSPDQAPDRYLNSVKGIEHVGRKRYAALVQGVDAGVGQITKALSDHALDSNTLVVFLSDNGGRRGSSDNRPLRGNKGWLHEGGIRVPFLLRWTGTLPAGSTYDEPIIALDVLPTALAAAGQELPDNLDGVDLLPFLRGGRSGRNSPPHRTPHRTLHWRVCGGDGFAIRHGDWKLVQDVPMDSPALYDLSVDIGENKDLASDQPERVAELLQLHRTWDTELRKPLWTEGHAKSVTMEREKAEAAGTRQFPMPWTKRQ